jgi:hypothetical protein
MEKSPPRLGDPLSHVLRPPNGAGERHQEEQVPFTLVGFYKELVSLIPKETRKAVRKTVRKAITRHGPEIATAIITGVVTSVLTAASTAKAKKKKKKKKKH